MNNDVIELAREMKKRSEAVLSEYSIFIRSDNDESKDTLAIKVTDFDLAISPENIIKICKAVEKLAEYENMEPVAWKYKIRSMDELHDEISEINPQEIDWMGVEDIIPLYRHSNK
ncbi:hypothetical protein [Xenorhabdus taiwanensis]|uniref:Phage protein n=1 Tax=Xenorhabdus taiwanensis TaxID=3085177 RepID=A0ABN7C4S5_9GAMM|nr:hypothetical protein TCT1_14020 [Xenorhabdus sp. TCT-1]BET97343.1 hypothetical protein TCT1_22640 [Xenorhabdus sp. TCT-1]BET97744.1 hypothetical protein TCT1_26650 [Xenorhabdus sp. TCT-1]